ncbi:MAG: toll/interleukin-1 receptor domain-containing protein, partial [Deltaproteobacteria bacterium]
MRSRSTHPRRASTCSTARARSAATATSCADRRAGNHRTGLVTPGHPAVPCPFNRSTLDGGHAWVLVSCDARRGRGDDSVPRIFISYRREKPDNEVALALYRRLSDAGHDVFLDSERIHVGERWPRTIRAALDYTEWFVALVSLQYLYSVHCKDELETAAKRHLRDDL